MSYPLPGICLRGKGALLLWSWEAVLSSGAFTKHSGNKEEGGF
jgi:hypothetical protein